MFPVHLKIFISKIIKKSIIGDVRDFKKLHNEIKKSKASVVFHLAAQPQVLESYNQPLDTIRTNVIGTANLLEIVRKLKYVNEGTRSILHETNVQSFLIDKFKFRKASRNYLWAW